MKFSLIKNSQLATRIVSSSFYFNKTCFSLKYSSLMHTYNYYLFIFFIKIPIDISNNLNYDFQSYNKIINTITINKYS